MDIITSCTKLLVLRLSVKQQAPTTLSITTFSTKGLFVTLSIMALSITTLSITKLCHYAKCHCAECRDLFIVMLNVVILSVIRLNVVAPNNTALMSKKIALHQYKCLAPQLLAENHHTERRLTNTITKLSLIAVPTKQHLGPMSLDQLLFDRKSWNRNNNLAVHSQHISNCRKIIVRVRRDALS
jgi:hypothetical protein